MIAKSDWRTIIITFLVGVAGAVQVGRIAPAATHIQESLNLDLVAVGWFVSLITLASALVGIFAGYWVVRSGLRVSLAFGAALMAVCAATSTLASSLPLLIGLRAVEGIGYMLVVVAAPTLIAQRASPKDAPIALATWGTFFTLGLGSAAFAGGRLSESFGWQGWFLICATIVLVTAVVAMASLPKDERHEVDDLEVFGALAEMPIASWLLGAAFLGVTLLSLAILSLLPAFLVQEHGFSISSAGGITGGIALASIIGSICYGVLANKVSDAILMAVAAGALVISTMKLFSPDATKTEIVPFAAIAIFMSGVLIAQTFAAVPRAAGRAHLIGLSNGLVAQLGSVGALSGPPLIGALIATSGWYNVPIVVAGFTLSFVLFFGLAIRSIARRRVAGETEP